MKNVIVSWKLALLLVAILLSSVFTSCSDDEKRLSDLTGFLTFEFSDVALEKYEFTIGSDNVITNQIALPYGFDASALTPVFTTAPLAVVNVAGVAQISGSEAMDFTKDVAFTVVAENGNNSLTYTVKVNVATTLSAWVNLTPDAAFGEFSSINAFMIGGKYYVLGGESTDLTYGLYSSEDGAAWSLVNDKILEKEGLGVGTSAVKHGDNQLLIGGHTFMDWADWSTGKGFATVYSSTDGVTWTDLAADTPAENKFTPRAEPMVANMNGDLFLVGGSSVAYGASQSAIGDAWKSTNGGVSWTNLEANFGADFVPRTKSELLVYKDELYLIGGFSKNPKTYYNDIYKSTDGVSWTKLAMVTPFDAVAGHICYIYNDRFYLIGGDVLTDVLDEDGNITTTPSNAMWVSDDAGLNWTKVTEGALPDGFAGRSSHAFIKDANTVYIFGGMGVDIDGTAKILADSWKGTLN